MSFYPHGMGIGKPFKVFPGKAFSVQRKKSAGVGLCTIWSFLWYRVVIMEKLYRAIALPVWLLLVAVSLIFLVYVIVRAVSVTARYCEGEWLWNYK